MTDDALRYHYMALALRRYNRTWLRANLPAMINAATCCDDPEICVLRRLTVDEYEYCYNVMEVDLAI